VIYKQAPFGLEYSLKDSITNHQKDAARGRGVHTLDDLHVIWAELTNCGVWIVFKGKVKLSHSFAVVKHAVSNTIT